MAFMSTGGIPGGGVRNAERSIALELGKARLSKLGATVHKSRTGNSGNDFILVEPPTPIATWDQPKIDTHALRIWVSLPEGTSIQTEVDLANYLANPDASQTTTQEGSSPVNDDLIAKLEAYRNVIVEGVAGTGKSHLIQTLKGHFDGRVRVVVFHPATAYEDFVEGLRPTGPATFEPRDGVFLAACRQAAQDPDNNHVLVIDEINRADTGKVLGDLLFAIEPSKRCRATDAAKILSASHPYSDSADGKFTGVELQLERPGPQSGSNATYRQVLVVPDNLLILGTMNTTDRSVGTIDLALRRRFVFHRLEPLHQHCKECTSLRI